MKCPDRSRVQHITKGEDERRECCLMILAGREGEELRDQGVRLMRQPCSVDIVVGQPPSRVSCIQPPPLAYPAYSDHG